MVKRQSNINLRVVPLILMVGLPVMLIHPAFASDANVTQVENFIAQAESLVNEIESKWNAIEKSEMESINKMFDE